MIAAASYRKQKAPGTLSSDVDVVSGEVKRDFDINPYSYALNTSRVLDPNVFYKRNYTDFNILHELDNNYMDFDVVDLKYQAEFKLKPIAGLELSIKVVGDGDKVIAQYPDAGREIPADGIIVVYTEQDHISETVTVPDFTGCTVSQANKLAVNSGLNIRISGSSLNSGTVYAYKQSIEAGQSVNMGEIITVSFKTNVDVAD